MPRKIYRKKSYNQTIYLNSRHVLTPQKISTRTAIKVVFLYFNVCLSVKLDSFSCSLTSISFLHNIPDKWSCSYKQDNKLHQCSNLHDKTLDQQSCSNQPHNIYLTSDCIPTDQVILVIIYLYHQSDITLNLHY